MNWQLVQLYPESINQKIKSSEQKEIVYAFFKTYKEVGYTFPWVLYLVLGCNQNALGCGGFKGKPVNGKVEIAYGTFKGYEGQGVANFICKKLISIALKKDENLLITAKTLREKNASTHILEKNGFRLFGPVDDKDDGEVWEWGFR
jgi:RimJ/RimL family protein N-acetyltransferase